MASQKEVTAVVLFYMVTALIMVFVNKIILNDTPELLVLTVFFQAIVTVALVHVSALTFPGRFEVPTLDTRTARLLLPVILADVAGFTLNAFCLREVEAAFYQVARGLALPFTIVVSSAANRSVPSLAVCTCAAVVCAGFFIGIAPPPVTDPALPAHAALLKPIGILYGLLASLTVSISAVLIKSSLPVVNGSAMQLAYWRNLGSSIILFAFALLRGELNTLTDKLLSGTWDYTTFAWGNAVTGVVGFLICMAGTLSVKVTSPVTHMFSSAARSVLQVLIGVNLFGDTMNLQRALSVAVILCGTILYTSIVSRQPPQPAQQQIPYAQKDPESKPLTTGGEENEKEIAGP